MINEQVANVIVTVFKELTQNVRHDQAVHLNAYKRTKTIINLDQSIDKVEALEPPEMKMFTKSQRDGMIGIVIKLPNANEITWNGSMGKYLINLDTCEFKKTK